METIRQVTLDGGLPWGFRIQGGKDTGLPLRIARVNPGSKASLQGIREGDAIVSINGKETENLTNSQAHGLLKDAGNTLCLSLAQGSGLSKKMFKSSVNADVRNNDTKTSGSETATTQSNAVSSTSKSVSTKVDLEDDCILASGDGESGESSVPQRPPRKRRKRLPITNFDCIRTDIYSDLDSDEESYRPNVQVCIENEAPATGIFRSVPAVVRPASDSDEDRYPLLNGQVIDQDPAVLEDFNKTLERRPEIHYFNEENSPDVFDNEADKFNFRYSTTEGIVSILEDMEKEILQAGYSDKICRNGLPDDMNDYQELCNGQSDVLDQQPMIGGLTVEEFVRFLALLERIREQHLGNKDPSFPLPTEEVSCTADFVEKDADSKSDSPYDNLETGNVCDKETDTGSCPSESESEGEGDFDLKLSSSIPAPVAALSLLFPRRFLHVIPEEGSSSEASNSTRQSLALSILSELADISSGRTPRSSGLFDLDCDIFPDYSEPLEDNEIPVVDALLSTSVLNVEDKEPINEPCDLENGVLPVVLEDLELPQASDEHLEEVDESFLPISVICIEDSHDTAGEDNDHVFSDSTEGHGNTCTVQASPRVDACEATQAERNETAETIDHQVGGYTQEESDGAYQIAGDISLAVTETSTEDVAQETLADMTGTRQTEEEHTKNRNVENDERAPRENVSDKSDVDSSQDNLRDNENQTTFCRSSSVVTLSDVPLQILSVESTVETTESLIADNTVALEYNPYVQGELESTRYLKTDESDAFPGNSKKIDWKAVCEEDEKQHFCRSLLAAATVRLLTAAVEKEKKESSPIEEAQPMVVGEPQLETPKKLKEAEFNVSDDPTFIEDSTMSIVQKAKRNLLNFPSKSPETLRKRFSTGINPDVINELRHYWKCQVESKASSTECFTEIKNKALEDQHEIRIQSQVPRLADLASQMLLSLPSGANLLQVINVADEETWTSHNRETEAKELVNGAGFQEGPEKCANESVLDVSVNKLVKDSSKLPNLNEGYVHWPEAKEASEDRTTRLFNDEKDPFTTETEQFFSPEPIVDDSSNVTEENESENVLLSRQLRYFDPESTPTCSGEEKKICDDPAMRHFGREHCADEPCEHYRFVRISSEETGYSTDSDVYNERTPPRPPPPCEDGIGYPEEPFWCHSQVDMPFVSQSNNDLGTPPRPPARNQNIPVKWVRKSGLWRRNSPSPSLPDAHKYCYETLEYTTNSLPLSVTRQGSFPRGSMSESSNFSRQSSTDNERLKATMLSDWLMHARKSLNKSAGSSPASTIKRSSISSVSSRSGTLRGCDSPYMGRLIHETDSETEAMFLEYRNPLVARQDVHKFMNPPVPKAYHPAYYRDFVDKNELAEDFGVCYFEDPMRFPKYVEEDADHVLLLADDATVEEGVTSFCDGNDHESKENSLLGEIEAALGMGLCKHEDGTSVISTAYTASSPKPGVWSPGQSDSIKSELTPEKDNEPKNNQDDKKEAPPPVWTPSVARSPSVERKEFRPVRLDTGSLRKQVSQDPDRPPAPPRAELSYAWQTQDGPGSTSSAITSPTSEHSFLTTSASTFLPGFNDERRPSNVSTNSTALSTPAATPTSNLPRAPNPTVTLLQKAREGSLPKGSAYLDSVKQEEPRKLYRSPFETVYTVKREYESEDEEKRKIIELAPKKFPGIGPTTNEGIPVALRTGINEENQHQWYRRMYDSLHRQGRPEDYVTVRYKTNRGRGGGYLSEPEPCDYDSDAGRYATLDRRRNRLREYESSNTPTRITHGHDTYRVQPGRIENYEPGRSSVVQHETKQWWDDIMGMLDGVQKQISTIERPFVGRSLKESGYESDSQLVFRRRTDQGDPTNDPREQKAYYRDIQRGGEVPLQGLRKPLPEKPKDLKTNPEPLKNIPKYSKLLPHFRWSSRISETFQMFAANKRGATKRSHEDIKERKKSSPKNQTAKTKTWKRVKGLKLVTKTGKNPEKISPVPKGPDLSKPSKDSGIKVLEEDDTDGGFRSPRFLNSERASRIFLQNRKAVTESKFLRQDPQELLSTQKQAENLKNSVAGSLGEIQKFNQTGAILVSENTNLGSLRSAHVPDDLVLQESSIYGREILENDSILQTNRVSELKSLYSSLERMSELEKKTVSLSDLTRLVNQGAADYQIWKKIRDHEKAEEEIRRISTWILSEQRKGNFYVLPNDVYKFKWNGDSGLRIKDSSVRILRERFQNVGDTWPRSNKSLTSGAAQKQRTSLMNSKLVERNAYEVTVRSPTNLSLGDLYVRSSSDSCKDHSLPVLPIANGKSLSVSGVGDNVVHRSQSLLLSSPRDASVASGERLTSRALNRRPRSTRAAIRYVQQLSTKLARETTSLGSSRDSSVGDHFLVLTSPTPTQTRKNEIEAAVKEWAAKGAPSSPKRASSLTLRDGTESRSSVSSVQTVIHRDVLEKVKFFETRIRQAKREQARSYRSVNDLPSHNASSAPSPPKRALSLNLRASNANFNVNAPFTSPRILLGSKPNMKDPIFQPQTKQTESLNFSSPKSLQKDQLGSLPVLKRKFESCGIRSTGSFKGSFASSPVYSRNTARKSVSFSQVKQTLLSSARLARFSGSRDPKIKENPTKLEKSQKTSSIEPGTLTTKAKRPLSKSKSTSEVTSPLPATPDTYDPTLHQPRYRYTPQYSQKNSQSIYATYPRRKHAEVSPPRPPLPAGIVTIPAVAKPLEAINWPPRPPLPAGFSTIPAAAKPTEAIEPQPDYFGVGGGYIQNAPGSAHKFSESEVTIGYKSPIRNLQNAGGQQEMEEDELRQRQADHMRRVYEQERRRKLLQELEDLESRRHMDNFTPSQKSPIPLNRYDTVLEEPVRFQQQQQQRDRTPEPKIVAKALYNFVAMNARELSFHKSDIIFVRRQIDKNWYEGEHNATVGIFPVNYVEIVPYDGVRMAPKKPTEVQAKVKHSFSAQSPAELSLVKGELLIVTRQIDDNWFEGRIGNRKGIFPAAYVEILQTPTLERQLSKPSAQPASHSLITNGSLRNTPRGHHLQQQTPYHQLQSPYQQQQIPYQQQQTPYQQQQQQQQKYSTAPRMGYSAPAEQSEYRQGYQTMDLMQNQGHLHVDTQSAGPVLYRALYPYVPQNDDELELQEGDTVCVLEKCDDGWYVGNSQRTGHFGTFPGNYVQRI